MAYTPIDKSNDYFNTVLYTGDWKLSTNLLQELGLQPDFTWIKSTKCRCLSFFNRFS
jgi:hypothetical protein